MGRRKQIKVSRTLSQTKYVTLCSCFNNGNSFQVYENNYDVFEEVDATAMRIAQDGYKVGGGGVGLLKIVY